jgi:hypothetical protein
MRNAECTIYIATKNGYVQEYRKDKDRWTQTTPDRTVRMMTAEQFLSHILPLLVEGGSNRASIRVEPDKKVNTRAESHHRPGKAEEMPPPKRGKLVDAHFVVHAMKG